jgi:hypothetical protein
MAWKIRGQVTIIKAVLDRFDLLKLGSKLLSYSGKEARAF